MGMYKYVQKLWKKPKENMPELWRERLIQWRREPSTLRIEHPTRIDRARSLGYKAKEGIIVVRQRILRGGRQRPKIRKGRKSKHSRRNLIFAKSYSQIAEERANKKYPNCEVLNSYWVAKDGRYYWFEIILVDRAHPVVIADKNLSWMIERHQRGRVFRGLTAAGIKSRGLLNKGKGAEKIRPGVRAQRR